MTGLMRTLVALATLLAASSAATTTATTTATTKKTTKNVVDATAEKEVDAVAAITTTTMATATKMKKAIPHSVPHTKSVYGSKEVSTTAAATVLSSGEAQSAAPLVENRFAQGPVVAGYNLVPQAPATKGDKPSYDNAMTYMRVADMGSAASSAAGRKLAATPKEAFRVSFSPSVIDLNQCCAPYSLSFTVTLNTSAPALSSSYNWIGWGIVEANVIEVNTGTFVSSGNSWISGDSLFYSSASLYSDGWLSGNYSLLIYTDDSHGGYHYFNPIDSFQIIGKDPKYDIYPVISQFKVPLQPGSQLA